MGGMRFKDIADFNLAQLTKMAWRAFKSPKMIWVRVLKGLYFLLGSFLEAKKAKKGSSNSVLEQHIDREGSAQKRSLLANW